ncbi:MAG: glycosyltransferase involved in cell wall biosynthesis [Cocleimonas sp.]
MNDDIKKPKVSVVCAWYNRADYIVGTVDSLLSQDIENYEVIIANDGSTDPRVKDILDSYDDPKLTVVHKENEGFTKTIKMLVDLAQAPFVAIQGAGDISYRYRLSKQYDFLLKNTNIGIVGSGFDIEIEGGGNSRYSPPKLITGIKELQKIVPFTHGTIMYRKSIYDRSGGYDIRFKYCSDWDLYFRILALSDIGSVNEALYKKIEFNDGFSFSPLHKFSQELHKSIAIYREQDRDLLVESLATRASEIKPYKLNYLYMSARYVVSFFKRKDYKKSYMWLEYLVKSFFRCH